MPLFIDNDKDRIIDVVMCIDLTAGSPIIDEVRRGAPTFCSRLADGFEEHSDFFTGGYDIRIRFVGYRDFSVDELPIIESPFFSPSTEEGMAEMMAFLDGLDAHGGGDTRQSGLDALAVAMRSDWRPYEQLARRIIVLWTNSLTHPLGTGADSPNYPAGMPRSTDELGELLQNGVGTVCARLFLLVPEADPAWSEICFWPRVYTINVDCVEAGNMNMDSLADEIAMIAK